MKNLIAYKNDPKLKAMLVKEIAWHKEQDMIIQGEYGKENGKWQGCAVGCSIHSLNLKLKTSYRYDDHSVYESALGIPIVLARLEDRIFEGLDKKIALDFPLQFAKAINVGADLSMISYKFLHWLLIDKKNGVINFTKKDNVIKSIEDVADLFKKHIAGNKVLKEEWLKVKNAADAAAAYADDAADAAADAYADDAADAAAYAAARKNHYKVMSEKLIELLKQTENSNNGIN